MKKKTYNQLKKRVLKRVHSLISKLDELQQIEREGTPDLRLPNIEGMKQALFNWHCDNQ